MQNGLIQLALLFVCGLLFFSCKREFDKPRWDTQIMAPLVKSRLSIKDIIKDTSAIQTEADNSITIVNRQQIFNYTIDSLVTLAAPPFKRTARLNSLVLSDQTLTRRISLGEIAKQLQQDPSTKDMGDLIISNNGNSLPFFPGVNNLTAGPIPIDISAFFQTATLLSGQMDVSIKNELPLTLSRMEFELRNKNPASLIASQVFTNLLSGATQTKTVNLANKTIGSNIEAAITDMDIASGFNVPIDTSKALIVTIAIKNIKVKSATAIFPAQNVMDTTTDVSLVDMGDILLTKAIIRNGSVDADITSTADDVLFMAYKIPKTIKSGIPFEFNATVPAKAVHYVVKSDFSGYDMDLRGPNNDQFNLFSNTLIARLNYTGQVKTLSLEDSLDISLTFQNAKPRFVKGYLGQDTIDIGPGDVKVDIFKNISANTLNFKSAKMNIVFENAFGVPSQVTLKAVTAYNTSKGTSLSLTGPQVNAAQAIAPAIESSIAPVTTTINLSTGTNVVDILNLLPDQLSYEGTFESNPLGNTGTYTDFARSGVDLKAYLDLQIPLSLIATQLVLSDTVAFDASSLKTSGFQDGKFNLLVWNGFPLDLNINMYFLDAAGKKLDSIVSANPILAASLDPLTEKVVAPNYSTVPFDFTSARLNTLMLHATQVLFTAAFDTKPAGTHVTVYSDYGVEFKLVGDMNIQVNSGQ